MAFSASDQQRLALLQKYPLSGNCLGQFAFCSTSSDFLQGLLPSDLELAPQTYTPTGQHPLLFMFNNTTLHANPNLENIAVETNAILNLNYFEFIVMLPYVQFKSPAPPGANGPYCFLPVLYLNSLLAVLGGRIFWEFNKLMADFAVRPGNYTVTDQSTSETLLSSITLLMGFSRPTSSLPNFQDITPILQLPVIEHGPYGYVSSIYKIGFQNVNMSPAGADFTNVSCSYMPSGLTSSPSITNNPLGGFHMNYDWALSYIEFIKF